MDLENLKLSGTNTINIMDSLEAPLLKLKVTINGETVIPESNDLIVKVQKSIEEGSEEKEYIFTLEKPLQVLEDISDEFIIEPLVKDGRSFVSGYVVRKIENGALLDSPVIEEVDVEDIVLYEGANIISTNYLNSILDLMYPKNCDLVKILIGLGSMDEEAGNCEDLYFKDCFTEIEDNKINAAFNKVTMKCFDSENQAFSMDCEGNLVVNSITTRDEKPSTGGTSFNEIYPVGSIYISTTNVNPSTYFGLTWEAFATGKTLVGVDVNQIEFNEVLKEGGDKYLQAHNHTGSTSIAGTHVHTGGTTWNGDHVHTGNTLEVQKKTGSGGTNDCVRQIYSSYDYAGVQIMNTAGGHSHTFTTDYNGDHAHAFTTDVSGGGAAQNLQPYITVYMWRRVA